MYQVAADPTAVMGRRIGAWLIDAIIVGAISAAIFSATVETATVDFNPCEGGADADFDVCTTADDIVAVWDGDQATIFDLSDTGAVNLFQWGYGIAVFWVWQGLAGMTPGKALTGIRTVNAQGQAPGVLRAFGRSVLWIVDLFPWCLPLVGPIAAASSTGHRRVGDMVAGTFVVSKDAMGRPLAVPGLTPPAAGYGAPAGYGAGGHYPPPGGTAPSSYTPSSYTPAGAPSPGAPPPGSWAPTEPSPPPSTGDARWDAARNAYIQWDSATQSWLQYDDAAGQWRPIDSA